MSEVRRLRQQIEEEYQAAQRAMNGYSITARHDFIQKRMECIESHRVELVQLVGDEKAMEILIEVNDSLAPAQKRTEPTYCVLVNGNVEYFGIVQALAEAAWKRAEANPRNRVEVSINGAIQAVREPVDEKQGKP